MKLLPTQATSTSLFIALFISVTLRCPSSAEESTLRTLPSQNTRELVAHPDKSNAIKQFPNSVNIRLHWEYDYLWQETSDETWWCMEMCKDKSNSPDKQVQCIVDKELTIRPCNEYRIEQQFVSGNGGTIHLVAYPDLCVTRVRMKVHILPCEAGNKDQMWQGFDSTGKKFSFTHAALGPGFVMCQQHHPKDRERISMWPLKLAEAGNTVYWEAWPKPPVKPPKPADVHVPTNHFLLSTDDYSWSGKSSKSCKSSKSGKSSKSCKCAKSSKSLKSDKGSKKCKSSKNNKKSKTGK